MSIGDFFKGLLLDTWYKAFVYIGGIALLLSFFVETKGISNIHLQLITSGIFLIGIGEWKNHKQDSWIKPPNAYTGPAAVITKISWQPDIIGIIFDLAGIVLLVSGILGAYKSSLLMNEISTPVSTISITATPDLLDIFSIGTRTFVDANNNGKVDPTDPPLPGVKFTVIGKDGFKISAVTDSKGYTSVDADKLSYPVLLQVMAPPNSHYIPLGSGEKLMTRDDLANNGLGADFLFVLEKQ